MRITVIREHEACPYNRWQERKVVELVEINEVNDFRIETNTNKIVLVLDGELYASTGVNAPQKVKQLEMFYVVVEQQLIMTTTTKATFLIFRVQDRVTFCNCFVIEKLSTYLDTHDKDLNPEGIFYIMAVCRPIIESLNSFMECLKIGLDCKYYYELKLKELLFLIGKFYALPELALFFKESLTNDVIFSDYIRMNAHRYKTMSELAMAMNYTISGFEKRFKKVFNTTPYQWMKGKKAERIYYDLSMTDKCLKEIVDNYEFKSSNYFIDFCKSNFGASPGVIRKNRGNKETPQ